MLDDAHIERLNERFESVAQDRSLTGQLQQHATTAALKAGTTICHQGDSCSHLALVLSGSARVFKLAESGREITLYRVEPGECCILTASCMLSGRPFPADASVVEPLEAVLVPAIRVTEYMRSSEVWRSFLWSLLAERLGDVIGLIEEVAFRRMDTRLAQYLHVHAAQHGSRLTATHGQIAAELGTSREVVSRLLKDLEQRGALQLHRGWIDIIDVPALQLASRLCD